MARDRHHSVRVPAQTRRRRPWALGWVGLLLCLLCQVGEARATEPTTVDAGPWRDAAGWRVLAVEYARSAPLAVSRLVAGADRTERVEMSWLFYVVVGRGRVVLVDTGTDEFATRPRGPLARKWEIRWHRTITESLQSVGLRPTDVTDILLTHRHWDHVDGTPRFPKARVHMHRDEWRSVSRAIRDAVPTSQRRLWEQSPHVPAPGLTMRVEGRHTRFHAVVEVTCRDRTIALVGDGAYLWANLTGSRPVTVTPRPADNVREMGALARRLGVWNVLPGHEPAIFSRYPSGDGRVAMICR